MILTSFIKFDISLYNSAAIFCIKLLVLVVCEWIIPSLFNIGSFVLIQKRPHGGNAAPVLLSRIQIYLLHIQIQIQTKNPDPDLRHFLRQWERQGQWKMMLFISEVRRHYFSCLWVGLSVTEWVGVLGCTYLLCICILHVFCALLIVDMSNQRTMGCLQYLTCAYAKYLRARAHQVRHTLVVTGHSVQSALSAYICIFICILCIIAPFSDAF